jgi:hypothetical protein
VVDRIDHDLGRLRGVLDGRTVNRSIRALPPELRAITVWDTGSALEPLALFLRPGGAMLTPSGLGPGALEGVGKAAGLGRS